MRISNPARFVGKLAVPMSDFYQNGVITTLHRLGPDSVPRLEAELKHFARERPMALVLPCLYSEVNGAGLRGIVEVLREVRTCTAWW